MTNYEWLVKNGDLAGYLKNITHQFYTDKVKDAFEKAAEHLQQPHTEKYVKLEDVYGAYDEAMIETDNGRILDKAKLLILIGKLALKGKDIEDDT